ncbi:MAG: putative DNA-binding domain-containing protein, partial [Ramlibacter sp.]|nr:putative DNA-binding domain-containing protein [Ramlibacter sp.]
MSLHDVQAWMQAAISEPARSDLAARAGEHLKSSGALDAHARLAIYQRSYRARLLQSFHAIFPGLLHALGRDMLDAFALDFLRHHPPHRPSVNRVADGFAEHLLCTRPASSREGEDEDEADWADFLVDLARLETLLLEVSEARGQEDIAAPDAASLRKLSAAQFLSLRPGAAPCLRLAACRFPVHTYLHALRKGDAPAIPQPRPVWLALTRVDYRL